MRSYHYLPLVLIWLVLTGCTGRAMTGADIPSGTVAQATSTATASVVPATNTPVPTKPTPSPAQAIIAPATKTPRPTATPTQTFTPEPTATPTPVDWLQQVERTEEQLITLGNPQAPVMMIDYSDFL